MKTPDSEEAIFAEAMRLAAEARAAYLARATGADAELRRRVELLLASYEAGDFLEDGAGRELRKTLTITMPITEKPGDTIGRYKLLQQIGEGGCGIVYMAEQSEPVRRRVALKIIKLGMDTKSVIARFEAERQALAMMDHPNIAKVLDAGATEAGRPYFVMELVRGVKITDYCDEAKLTTRARLDLFIHVCHAIQHAHQKGIIHRDIKPSNILVTLNDGAAVPKVIDFGIAKATSGQQLTDKTLFTAFEQFIGTPAYMSPEQAMLTSLDIDTRSDIYALGVLLYELLTGKTPFDPKKLFAAGLDEMRRTIREQEPPRPSTCLTDLVAADVRRLTTTGEEKDRASSRRLLQDKERLVSELRGDLDWIVMKALEKERARRYETANGLAADIQRHLNNEPILARPATNIERVIKWTRRRPAAAAIVSVIALAVVACAILAVYASKQALRATRHAEEAASARQTAEATAQREALERKRAETALSEARRASYQANISAADAYLRGNEMDEVLRRLDACDPSLRNWEWQYLKYKSDSSALTIGRRGRARLSPDGRSIVTQSLELWDTVSGEVKLATNPRLRPDETAFSADGRLLAAGSTDLKETNKICVWKTDSLEEVATIQLAKTEAVTSLAFDPEKRFLVAGVGTWILQENGAGGLIGKGKVYLCELSSPFRVRMVGEDTRRVDFVAVSPNGKRIVGSTGGLAEAKFWDVQEGLATAPSAPFKNTKHAEGTFLFTTDRETLALVSRNDESAIIDVFSGTTLHRFKNKFGRINACGISLDHSQLVVAENNLLQVWDLPAGKLAATYSGLKSWINYVCFTPDGSRLIASDHNEVKIWDLLRRPPVVSLGAGKARGEEVLFGPGGETILTGGLDALRSWDVDSKLLTAEIPGRSASLAVNLKTGLSAEAGEEITLRRLEDQSVVAKLPGERGSRFWRVAFANDGRELLGVLVTNDFKKGNGTNVLRIWNVARREVRTNILSQDLMSAKFSPDGTKIALGRTENSVRPRYTIEIVDAKTYRSLLVLPERGTTFAYCFDASGKRIFIGGYNVVWVWDLETQSILAETRSGSLIRSLALSPDGSRLLTGGDDQEIRVWDSKNLQLLLTIRESKPVNEFDWVTSINFSPDGSQVALALGRGAAAVLSARQNHPIPEERRGELTTRMMTGKVLERLFDEHVLVSNVLRELQERLDLDPKVKSLAITLAGKRDEQLAASELSELSRKTSRKSDRNRADYELALKQAVAANAVRKDAPTLLSIAMARYRLGEYKESLSLCERILEIDPAATTTPILRAMCYHQMGDAEKARSMLKAATFPGFSDDISALAPEADQLISPSK